MKIEVLDLKLEGNNRILCKFDTSEELKKYFNEFEFYAEYNSDISNLPKTILAIPFLSNILPVVWFTGSTLYIDEIDREFYDCLDNVRDGFKKMYPQINIEGEVVVGNIIESKKEKSTESPIVLFSGGVDSLVSFIRHKEKKPYLMTVWGSDIKLSNESGWEIVKANNTEFAKKHGLENIFIKSNFFKFMDETKLCQNFEPVLYTWWGQIQHGFALAGLCAPVSFSLGANLVCVPSSDFIIEAWGSVPCIDNNIRWSQTKVVHDAEGVRRQQKLAILAEYIRQQEPDLIIRACVKDLKGENCGVCEKCARTMTGLMVEGIDPQNHRYPALNSKIFKLKLATGEWGLSPNILDIWKSIQQRLKEKGIPSDSPYKDYLEWFSRVYLNWYEKIYKVRKFIRTLKYKPKLCIKNSL